MRVVMMTNTYLPHVGGVARSVETFTQQLRSSGHEVLVVAPESSQTESAEAGVLRVPAVQNFNGSDFAVRLPIPGLVSSALTEFQPDILHVHHPFLLGDTAQRVAAQLNLPLVFTHHTMYERYTHYVPGDSSTLQRFVRDLATHFANLCDGVIAPSESIADELQERGVTVPIVAIPTGIDLARFSTGNGNEWRSRLNLPRGTFLLGHVGRLAPEKNLTFLAHAVVRFLHQHAGAHFFVVGSGPCEEDIQAICQRAHVADRLHLVGSLSGRELVDAYSAMDAFAFASTSETQGLVLAEAMTAGVPVVALDAPGAREVVRDYVNGRLLPRPEIRRFSQALMWIAHHADRRRLRTAARQTAELFSAERSCQRLVELYDQIVTQPRPSRVASQDDSAWEAAMRMVEAEYQLWTNRAAAASSAISDSSWRITRAARRCRRAWRRVLEKVWARERTSNWELSPTDGTIRRRPR